MKSIEIYGTEIGVKEYKGRRVVTFRDIDAVHQRPEGTARKRFNDNKAHFVADVDYFVIEQPSEIRTLGITRPQGGTPEQIIIVTESGYLMLVKSFTDDLAWQVQRELVNTYFKVKEILSGNLCAAAIAKDMISKWKRRVSIPLIERLHILNDNWTIVETYAYIYRCMHTEYCFDMNDVRENYGKKYDVPFRDVSVIDAVADDRELRQMFVVCADKQIRDFARERVKSALRCEECSIKILDDISECDRLFDAEFPQITAMSRECVICT